MKIIYILFRSVSDLNQSNWLSSHIILIREKNGTMWYRYNWLLDIDLINNYKNLNNYKIYKSGRFYKLLSDRESMYMLKAIRSHLDQTVLYHLLKSRDLLWMKNNIYFKPQHSLHIAIPDSQIEWNNYELIWAYEFYLK